MFLKLKIIKVLLISCCLFTVAVTTSQANDQTAAPNWGQGGYSGMGGGYHPMFNPAMWMNPMTWMNPGNYMSLMNPGVMMNPGNYMQMMNPMAYMSMMNPMMAMMGPMMNPMAMMGGTGYGNNNQTGQMMDPNQYNDWYKQWTDMMQNMTPQANQ